MNAKYHDTLTMEVIVAYYRMITYNFPMISYVRQPRLVGLLVGRSVSLSYIPVGQEVTLPCSKRMLSNEMKTGV